MINREVRFPASPLLHEFRPDPDGVDRSSPKFSDGEKWPREGPDPQATSWQLTKREGCAAFGSVHVAACSPLPPVVCCSVKPVSAPADAKQAVDFFGRAVVASAALNGEPASTGQCPLFFHLVYGVADPFPCRHRWSGTTGREACPAGGLSVSRGLFKRGSRHETRCRLFVVAFRSEWNRSVIRLPGSRH